MSKSSKPLHLLAAEKEIGVHEVKGSQHNQRIVAYHQATTLAASDDETPWCAAFVNWCLEVTGQRGTRSATARSFLKWGDEIELTDAKPGDVAVFSRGNSPWQGHVAFFLQQSNGRLEVLGGNQGDAVTVATYPKAKLLGVRRAN